MPTRFLTAILFLLLGLSPSVVFAQSDELKEVFQKGAARFQAGQYSEAVPLWSKAVALAEQEFGPEHPETAALINYLAMLYRAQGRYVEAEPLYKRALAIMEKVLGPNHPDMAGLHNNLAMLYQAQSRYGEAEALHKRALVIVENVHGPDHPDVGVILIWLAALHDLQRNYEKAEPLLKRALAINEKVNGPHHQSVAEVLEIYAAILSKTGRDAEASELKTRAKAIRGAIASGLFRLRNFQIKLPSEANWEVVNRFKDENFIPTPKSLLAKYLTTNSIKIYRAKFRPNNMNLFTPARSVVFYMSTIEHNREWSSEKQKILFLIMYIRHAATSGYDEESIISLKNDSLNTKTHPVLLCRRAIRRAKYYESSSPRVSTAVHLACMPHEGHRIVHLHYSEAHADLDIEGGVVEARAEEIMKSLDYIVKSSGSR